MKTIVCLWFLAIAAVFAPGQPQKPALQFSANVMNVTLYPYQGTYT